MSTQQPWPPGQPAPAAYPSPVTAKPKPSGGAMVARHLVSALVALVLVPLAAVCLDIGTDRGLRQFQTYQLHPSALTLVWLVVGAVLLLVVGLTARLSGLGPLLAGVVWGVVPGALLLLVPRTFLDIVRKLPEFPDGHSFWFTYTGFALFPVLAALLIGGGLAGRWRS